MVLNWVRVLLYLFALSPGLLGDAPIPRVTALPVAVSSLLATIGPRPVRSLDRQQLDLVTFICAASAIKRS